MSDWPLTMGTRPQPRREKDFKPGVVTGWRERSVDRAALVRVAYYIPDGKHKRYPAPNREWTLCTRPEGEECPRIDPKRWFRLQEILRAAMAAGAVMFRKEDPSEYPARVWAFIDGRLFEARRSNAENGGYHGFPLVFEQNFPLDPHDLLARAPRESL